jgi:hypothetical protein
MRSATSLEGSQLVMQNCGAICTNEGGHRDTFSNDAVRFRRPAQQATMPQAKREARSVLCHVCQ